MADTNAKLTVNGEEYGLPIITGALGRPVIDIAALQDSGFWSYDPGFKVTAPVESKITYIDGGKGELLHRGYPIDQLANNAEYLEVAYALIHGDLPNSEEKADFFEKIRKHTGVHDQLRKFFEGFRRDAHPMAIMVGVVGALSAFYHDNLDVSNEEHREITAIRLIAKMPTLAAMSYKYCTGRTVYVSTQ